MFLADFKSILTASNNGLVSNSPPLAMMSDFISDFSNDTVPLGGFGRTMTNMSPRNRFECCATFLVVTSAVCFVWSCTGCIMIFVGMGGNGGALML